VNEATWKAVDDYAGALFAPHDDALAAALRDSESAGLPAIQVSAPQGRLLQLLVLAVGATRVLEIGTLGGYSTIWMARALPAGGRLVSLEADAKHAGVARANLARAGLADRVEVTLGAALESLPALAAAGGPPFDFVFIDADKPSMPAYLDWAVKLSRPGALIVADNVVREGAVLDPAGDASVQGVRAMHERIAADPRLVATVVQTVGAKGYDGFTLVRVSR
jgi:predicted O-methyltransferase YrrM